MIRINKKKLRDELVMIGFAILGIIIFICNMKKVIPGFGNPIETVVSYVIAYGFFIGPLITVIATASFWEIRNKRYPRKRTR